MLCQFNFREEITIEHKHYSVDSNNKTIEHVTQSNEIVPTMPTILQYLISFWVFTFYCEELRQFLRGNSITRNFYLKVKSYLNDNWNYLDIIGCIIFSIGMSMRITAFYQNDENTFIAAR